MDIPSCLLFTILVVIAIVHNSGSQDCSIYSSCDACIASGIHCLWCNSDAYRVMNTNQSGAPIKFCGTQDELINGGCLAEHMVGPLSEIFSAEANDSQQVTPGNIELRMRPGDPKSFTINVAPQADFPIDLYILMDLTASQQDALDDVRAIIDDIVDVLAELSSDGTVGFGSFSDKRAVPFNHVSRELSSYPCAEAYSAVGIGPSECDATYDFRHRLNQTSDINEIKMSFQDVNLTASIDKPEGLMDALMQVAVCEEKVGWRDSSLSRRIVMAITGDEYHYALDGRVAAILDRHDGGCHLDDNGFYTHDILLDYPSTTQMEESLTTHSIIPIFVADAGDDELYESLAKKLRSASVVVREAGRPDKLLNLFRETYRNISTTIIPSLSNNELQGIVITVVPAGCGTDGFLSDDDNDVCRNVSSPDSANYTVTVEVTPEACTAYPSGHVTANVYFVGFGEVTVNIELLCTCNCSTSVDQQPSKSPECNNKGVLQCSSCQCDDGFYGGDCSCKGAGLASNVSVCKANPGDSLMCSGHGDCVCGECECNPIEGRPDLTYSGRYCQCDDTQCPTSIPGTICSGHGSCLCNGACSCNDGFIGFTCNCPTSSSSCINPDGNQLCSNHGDCRCGICVCQNYTLRSGTYCQLCPPCSQNCLRTSDDVLAVIQGTCQEGQYCKNLTLTSNLTLVEEQSEGRLRSCVASLDTCRVTYQIDSLKFGTEYGLFIHIDMNSSSYNNIKEDSCSSSTPVWPWIVGIVVGIILVGVLALVMWKCIIYWKDYFEYRGFLKMQQSRRWVPKQNPLYLPAKSSYINPQFGRKESLMK